MEIVNGRIYQREDLSRWVCRFYEDGSGRREKWFKTKREAQEFLKDNLYRPIRDARVKKMNVSRLVVEFLMACRTGRDGNLPLTRDTVRSYEAHLKRFTNYFGDTLVRDITIPKARHFQMYLLESCKSRTTAQSTFTITKTMLKYAVAHEYISRNPLENLSIRLRSAQHDTSKRVKIFSTEELKHLLFTIEQLRNTRNLAEHKKWTQFYPIVLCLSFLGLRSSEAFGLQFGDFSEHFASVEIRRRLETPKKGMSGVRDGRTEPWPSL